MDDFCRKIKSGEPLNFPPLNPTQGCLKEASRLQLNVGEQGSVKMIEDIYQHAQLIHTGQFFFDILIPKTLYFHINFLIVRLVGSSEDRFELLDRFQCPVEFLQKSSHRKPPPTQAKPQIEPISPT